MAKNINIELTKGDTETLLWTFTDSNGDAYAITSNTFTFTIGTTEGATDVLSKTGGDFTLSSNTATLELSTTDTAQSVGQYWYNCSFVDSNSKKTTVTHGNCAFTLERTGQTNSTGVTVGTTTLNVEMNIAYGTQDAFGSNFTAKGDIAGGTGSETFDILSVGTNGQILSAASGETTGLKWITASGTGDMNAATYDPNTIAGDAFDMDNMVEGTNTKILTATERSAISANSAKVTNATHTGDVTGSGALTIADDAVTYAKIQNVAADGRLLGNVAGAGQPVAELTATQVRTLINVEDGATADQSDAEIKTAYENNANTNAYTDAEQTKVGHISVTQAVNLDTIESDTATNNGKITNATHTGDVTGSGALTIANDAVTYAKMQNVAADNRILGNVAGAGQPVAELTATQVRTLINVADGATANTGTVDTSGTPVANDFAKFTDSDTIEGRSYTETKSDLSLNLVENTALSTWAGSANLNTYADYLIVPFSDQTTAFTTGTAKYTFTWPNFACTLTDISGNVITAPTGSSIIIDVNEGGTTIMTTNKIEIEVSETSSETATTQPVLTDTAIAANAIITIDIDQIGSTIAGAGGAVIFYFRRT